MEKSPGSQNPSAATRAAESNGEQGEELVEWPNGLPARESNLIKPNQTSFFDGLTPAAHQPAHRAVNEAGARPGLL
jgi:hypothetical protein